MNLLENIKIAIRSVRSNILRSLLTILIIMVGITSLVGILTAIDTIIMSLNDNFSSVGGNTFSITPKFDEIKSQRRGRWERQGDPITFKNAMEFQERYNFAGSMVSVSTDCTNNATVKYKDEKTNPTINIKGVDFDFFEIAGFEIIEGRNFTRSEISNGAHLAIIGSELVNLLFDKNPEKAINKVVDIDGNNYRVIGTLKSKGSGGNTQNDRNVFIPLLNAKQYYHYADKEYKLDIGVMDALRMDDAQSNAIGVFRNVRKLKSFEDNDFEIRKSDSLLNMIKEATFKIRIATIAIALITLLGAAIGLMNIMLVSVTERTQEVGVRKALGATRNNILVQFLTEAVVIGQIGGILGIIFGIIIGLGLAIYIDGKFVIPWAWILLGFMVNMIVGIISGLYPAMKAARLDPIESLRHE